MTANRRFTPPPAGAKPSTSSRPAPAQAGAASNSTKPKTGGARPDLDLVACDGEFSEVEKIEREIKGKMMSISRRVGALWLGRPFEDGSVGAPFVRLGEEGEDGKSQSVATAKLYKEEEGEEGVQYTLRLLEKKGDKSMPVKGMKGALAEVWWPEGGAPQFTFTAAGKKLFGGSVGFALGFGKKKAE